MSLRIKLRLPLCPPLPPGDEIRHWRAQGDRHPHDIQYTWPLDKPAGAQRQVLGVFASKLTETLASVLGNLGAIDCMVVHGEDGLDEITTCDGTKISRFRKGFVDTFYIRPEDFGFKKHDRSHLVGNGKDTNARIALSVLNGEEGHGVK